MKLVISSPKLKSRALKSLAETLSERVGYKVYRVKPHRVRRRKAITFCNGIDKITQLQAFTENGVPCPPFALSKEGVASLDAKVIVARKLTRSSEGKGIEIFEKGAPIPNARLYTAYIPKKSEFRVHVFNNEVILVTEKKKKRNFEDVRDTKIRNKRNGYTYVRNDVTPPGDTLRNALAAVQALGRSYGAVDIIWNERRQQSFVLEVNSLPGMEGSTLNDYANAILK